MTTAFVLSGGGSLGAVEAGMLLALTAEGIRPDLLVGTSVGAINAAWMAGDPGPEGAARLASIWREVRRGDVFPTRLLAGFLGFVGNRNYLVPSQNLRRLITTHLRFEALEDARVPLLVIAAEISTGMEVVLSSGDAVEALLASTAIPAVFPPVTIGGRTLVDGGVLDNAPISRAVEAGATTVYVLPTGYTCAYDEAPRTALDMALQAITLMTHQRLISDVERYQDAVDLRVVPPLCPLTVTPVDFSRTVELIERAEHSTRDWLASDAERAPDQTQVLKLHRHRRS